MGFISNAYADVGAGQDSTTSLIFMIAIFAVVFYFFIYRPQAKKTKEHRNLMNALSKGEEVLTAGGLMGKIVRVSEKDPFVVLLLNDTTEVTIKRDFIVAILPKGSLKSI